MTADANEINRFKELTFTMGRKELEILKSAAKNSSRGDALTMCRLYVPSLPPEQATKFMDWLAQHKD